METVEARSRPHRLVFSACCPHSCLLLLAGVYAAENSSPPKNYWHKAHRLLTIVFKVARETNSRWKTNVLTTNGCASHDCMCGRRPPKKLRRRLTQYFHIGPKFPLSRRHTGRRFSSRFPITRASGSPTPGPRLLAVREPCVGPPRPL